MEGNRREFLGAALAAAPMFVPATARGATDRLSFGIIGTGGRGRYAVSYTHLTLPTNREV